MGTLNNVVNRVLSNALKELQRCRALCQRQSGDISKLFQDPPFCQLEDCINLYQKHLRCSEPLFLPGCAKGDFLSLPMLDLPANGNVRLEICLNRRRATHQDNLRRKNPAFPWPIISLPALGFAVFAYRGYIKLPGAPEMV